MRREKRPALLAALLGAHATMTGFAAEPGEIAEYSAGYEVEYNGRRVARAEFSVAQASAGQFIFNSSTKARGIWRLAAPRAAIEWSQFSMDREQIVPISFRYEDGSRKGEDNYTLRFDASSGNVVINGPAGESSLPHEPGLLDRGSLQVALMFDLGLCQLPGPYRYVDDDGVREYVYERLEDLSLETELGTVDTVRFSQKREGSSRNTLLWLAPALAYLPVRIEQIRDGEAETVLSIASLTGLERQPSSCSGLR
jgi:hypothetical protein